MHITLKDPERIQAYKSGLGLPAWHPASGFSLRGYRAPVGRRAAVTDKQIGISL
jgi:hypothetical protein